jgi:uncharacterized protein (DUF1330 family)
MVLHGAALLRGLVFMAKCIAIAEIQVLELGAWTEYKRRVPTTLHPFGAEIIFRGKDQLGAKYALIEFPTSSHANNWLSSDAYASLIPIREKNAHVKFRILEALHD